jgi:sugar-specific transcriptional regulator TrmB
MISIEKLQLFGLTRIEAEIYGYLLNHGPAGATSISKEVKVGRTNVYDYTKSLEIMGLIKQMEKQNKLFFQA